MLNFLFWLRFAEAIADMLGRVLPHGHKDVDKAKRVIEATGAVVGGVADVVHTFHPDLPAPVIAGSGDVAASPRNPTHGQGVGNGNAFAAGQVVT